jgi:(2Fe-2S) ferredoxin
MAKDLTKVQKIVFICNGECCLKAGANENTLALRAELKDLLLHDEVHTVRTRCMGQCKQGPVVFIHPEGVWYKNVFLNESKKIASDHLLKNTWMQQHVLYPAERRVTLNPITIRRLTFRKMFKKLCLKIIGK